ncbi:MAG: endonuclease MutS2, partial [bacterium]|nr:endonuclease MutS2 [bacterium]
MSDTALIRRGTEIDAKSLEILEFPRVRDILASFTSFSASRQLALDLSPSADAESVSRLLRQSAEARYLLATEPAFTIGGVTDIREPARIAAVGKVLEPPTLLDIQNTLAAIRHLRADLSRRAEEVPLLWSLAEPLVDLPEIEKEIGGCISSTAEVLDSASTRLLNLRQHLKEKRQEVLSRLEGLVK